MEKTQNYKEIKCAVECHENVKSVKNGFFKALFGSKTTFVYAPTETALKSVNKMYVADDYDNVRSLVTTGKLSERMPLTESANGNVRVECYYASDDKSFCALQVWRFIDLAYVPVTNTYFYTGPQAADVIDALKL